VLDFATHYGETGISVRTVEMFKIAIIRCDKRDIPLTSRCGDPGIGRRDRSPCRAALGHDTGPDVTGIFIRKQSCTEIDVPRQFLAP
jgi:hypothetical protein